MAAFIGEISTLLRGKNSHIKAATHYFEFLKYTILEPLKKIQNSMFTERHPRKSDVVSIVYQRSKVRVKFGRE